MKNICFTAKNKKKHYTLTIFIFEDELSVRLEQWSTNPLRDTSRVLFREFIHKDEYEKIGKVKNAIKAMNINGVNTIYSASISEGAYCRLGNFLNLEFSVIATLDGLVSKLKKYEN